MDVATLKRFLKWYCDGRKGRLGATRSTDDIDQRLTQNSVYTYWKSFMSAWHRRTGDTFSKSIQHTIETLIYGGDDNWLNLRTARRASRNFTLTDFQACVRQLWQNDWYDYRCEMYRICLHLMMLMHIGTSARSAEYVIHLRYRDTLLYQVWFKGCTQPQLVIDLCRNHTKGLANLPRQQPEHLLYELVDLPFYYNTVGFFMVGVLANNGLRDFNSWAQICAMPKPTDRNFVLLDYSNDLLDRLVFARYGKSHDHADKPATSLIGALGDLGYRTGFRDKPTPGAIRREALLQVDRHGYSINERMRHADHRNPGTYGGYYQNAISTVDGQATYFGVGQQLPALHELFRGFSIRRDYDFRPELSRQLQDQIGSHTSKTDDINGAATPNAERADRQKMYDQRRQRKHRLIRGQHQELGRTTPLVPSTYAYESDFHRARRLMPERDRLASALFESGSLRDSTGVAIVEDLVSLYTAQNSDTYCASLNSSPALCDSCGVTRRDFSGQKWWSHVYRCRQQCSKEIGKFSEFYFLYYEWIEDVKVWDTHAQQHYTDLPLKCSLTMFRGTILRPGLCPDCVGSSTGQGSTRFIQFLNVTNWKAHVDDHVRQMPEHLYKCRHPRCSSMLAFRTFDDYITHRSDIHLIAPPDAAKIDICSTGRSSRAQATQSRAAESDSDRDFDNITAGTTISHRVKTDRGSEDLISTAPSSPSLTTCPRQGKNCRQHDASVDGLTMGRSFSAVEPSIEVESQSQGQIPSANRQEVQQRPDISIYDDESEISSVDRRNKVGSTPSSDQLCTDLMSQPKTNASIARTPRSATVEVVIPTRPAGWEMVPIFGHSQCVSSETSVSSTVSTPTSSVSKSFKNVSSHLVTTRNYNGDSTRKDRHRGLDWIRDMPANASFDHNGHKTASGRKTAQISARRKAIVDMHTRIKERRKLVHRR